MAAVPLPKLLGHASFHFHVTLHKKWSSSCVARRKKQEIPRMLLNQSICYFLTPYRTQKLLFKVVSKRQHYSNRSFIEVGVLFLFEEKTQVYKGENTKWRLSPFDEAALLSVKDKHTIYNFWTSSTDNKRYQQIAKESQFKPASIASCTLSESAERYRFVRYAVR